MNINAKQLALSKPMLQVLAEHLKLALVNEAKSRVTINFRDSSYSAEAGGYHPVEICLEQQGDDWQLLYITDFAYCGGIYPELEVELDFNCESGLFSMAYQAPVPLTSRGVSGFYKTWEKNFLSYLAQGSFDQIKLT